MTDQDRRAQIIANAERRAKQAAAMTPSPAAPAQAPAQVQMNPEVPHQPPRAMSGNKDAQISVVPKGTKPSPAANRTRNTGAVTVGAGRPAQRGTSTNVTQVQGRSNSGVVQRQGHASGGIQRVASRPQGATEMPVQRMVQSVAPVSSASTVDCSIVLAYHARPVLIETQQRILAAQSVRPAGVVAWVNPSQLGVIPDASLANLAEVGAIYPSFDMGPWMRWAVAAQCASEYVAVLDDDCLPGPQWLQRAIERIASAGPNDVIVAAGGDYRSDAPGSLVLIGPENPIAEETSPDIGRGGWLMRTDTARQIASRQRFSEVLSTGLHVAAIVQEMGGAQIMLSYGADRSIWGMMERSRNENSMSVMADQAASVGQSPGSSVLRDTAYFAYRESGWMPMCVAASQETTRIDASTAAQ